MNKETFNSMMLENGWEFIGKPDVSTEMSTDPNTNWEERAKQNQYKRSMFIIYATDEDIEKLDMTTFYEWFKEMSRGFWFPNDWRKAFKGSEFLEPVVEKEIRMSKHMTLNDLLADLHYVKEGRKSIDEVIEKTMEVLRQTHQTEEA